MSTTPTERRLAITPGEAKMADGNKPWVNDSAGFCIADFGWDEDRDDRGNAEALANATLYADAHNTYNACLLTPSELWAKLRAITTEIQGAQVSIQRTHDQDRTLYAVVDLDDWHRILAKLNLKP